MAVLLTNADGFSAHVVLLSNKTALVTGDLQGRGVKLLFTGDSSSSAAKRLRQGGISFIWDTAANSGYVLSEALQGYAPMALAIRVTNLVARAAMVKAVAAAIEGHRCDQEEVTLSFSDGSTAEFHVWRAVDLKRFPLRISSASDPASFTFNFTNVRLAVPPNELFQPPEDFTKYENAAAMMDELAFRQQDLRRGAAPRGGDDGGGVSAPKSGGPRGH